MSYVKRLLCFAVLTVVGCGGGFIFFSVVFPLLDIDHLSYGVYTKPTIVLSAQGNELCRFEREHREPVSLARVSPHLINAFVAAEDRSFFDHQGISVRGIFRAIMVNLAKRRFVQGASTITQQVIKLRFSASQRTMARKIREQILAFIVEGLYSKEQILETYLNLAYFGAGLYGVEAAAQAFWKKSAAELSPSEAALLAGIVKSPQAYCPLYNPDRARARRNIVLSCMQRSGFLSMEQLVAAQAEPVRFAEQDTRLKACSGYIHEHIRKELEQILSKEEIYNKGFVVQTTFDEAMQHRAEDVFRKKISELRAKKGSLDGALVVIEGETGALKALIGGYDFSSSQFNRATQARRQIGSLIKPLVYAAALQELGITFADTCIDEALPAIAGWSPRNVNRSFEGKMTLAHALVVSNNVIPVKLFLRIGPDPIIRLLQAAGLPGPFNPYPALTLGCLECTPFDVVHMFNTIIQQGVPRSLYCIEWIKDSSGRKIMRHATEPNVESALPWFYSSQVVSVLQLISRRMASFYNGVWIAGDFACKTGTTNQQRSCWFTGATPRYTGVVYLGSDTNDSLEHLVYSGRHAMPILVETLRPFSAKDDHFYHAQGLQERFVDPSSGTFLPDICSNCYTFLCPSADGVTACSRTIC